VLITYLGMCPPLNLEEATKGPTGDRGQKGEPGIPGRNGEKGDRGYPGETVCLLFK
jgi:hypothetical protein